MTMALKITSLYVTPRVLRADHPAPGYHTQYVKIQADYDPETVSEGDEIFPFVGMIPLSIFAPFDPNIHSESNIVRLSVYDHKTKEVILENFIAIFDLKPILANNFVNDKWPGNELWDDSVLEEGEME